MFFGTVGPIVTFILFFSGDNKPTDPKFKFPSISLTGGHYPEIIVFNMTLHIVAVATILMGWVVYSYYKSQFGAYLRETGSNWVNKLNAFTFFTAIYVAFMLACTASVSIVPYHAAHGFFAGCMFLGAAFWGGLVTIINAKTRNAPNAPSTHGSWYRYRLVVILTTVIIAVIYVVIMGPFMLHQCCPKGTPAGTCHLQWCAWKNWRNVVEYILVAFLGAFIFSLKHETSKVTLDWAIRGKQE